MFFDDAMRAADNPGISGITTGITDLDKRPTGCKINSIVIAAPPSMGKTTFAMNLVTAALPHVQHQSWYSAWKCRRLISAGG